MSDIAHITVRGDLEGDFVVTEERPGGKFVIERDTSWKAVQARAGAREATDAEFAAFEAEHGPFLPPDGEGWGIAAKKGHAPVVFEGDFFDEDVLRAGEAGAKAAGEARRDFERDGVPNETLKLCETEGDDGTKLPHCVKVYLPPPAGKFGMVLQLEIVEKRSQLRYLAFGVRHHPKGSHAETVYQIAHHRLNGWEPAAISLDNLRTVPKALPTEPITALGAEKMDEACRALAVATTCVHEGNPDAKVTVLPGMDEEDVRRLAELAAARGKTAYPTNEDDFIDEFRPPTLPAAARPAAPMPA